MWIFTKYGFFSATACKDDPQRMQVRARLKIHLENLKNRFKVLQDADIIYLDQRDYAYRIYVPKAVWVNVVTDAVDEIEYNNFKDEVKHFSGKDEYYSCLIDVWSTMFTLQCYEQPVEDAGTILVDSDILPDWVNEGK